MPLACVVPGGADASLDGDDALLRGADALELVDGDGLAVVHFVQVARLPGRAVGLMTRYVSGGNSGCASTANREA
jgi:hypothetical protein